MVKPFCCTVLLVLALSGFGQTETSEFELLQNKAGGLTITAYRGGGADVVIPAEIGGMNVTVIGRKAFFGKDLTSVSIPESVTLIDVSAFSNNRLSSLTVPAGVSSIAYEAFADNELVSVSLPESMRSIGIRAFARNKLTGIVIPGMVSNIGNGAFAGNSITDITIGASRNIFTSQGFELSFVNFYESTKKQAGTYTKAGGIWSLQTDIETDDPPEP